MIAVLYFLLFLVGLISNWGVVIFSLCLVLMMSLMSMYTSFASHLLSSMIMFSTLGSLMVLLSLMLCLLSLISTPDKKSEAYTLTLLCLTMMVLMVFCSGDLINFYIFFEASLIPTLLLIILWGYQPERLISGVYMMLYTVGASFPLLLLVLYLVSSLSSTSMALVFFLIKEYSWFTLLSLGLAFMVKLPMYTVHLWLPKAHVEAPLAGSMMLAGILLKLGGYGLWVMLPLIDYNYNSSLLVCTTIISVALWGGFMASLMCLQQVDIKSLVAYSSVAHMSIVLCGLMMGNHLGEVSAKVTMFTHGCTSSCMFVLAYASYEKVSSRSFKIIGGFLSVYPVLVMLWFIMCMMNMAAPPFVNLLGELFIIPSLWSGGGVTYLVLMMLMVFMSACYNMYLYTQVSHGVFNRMANPMNPTKEVYLTSVLMHIYPSLFLFNMMFYML